MLLARPSYRHGYRADIDGLRAIAVLSVVLFHAAIPPFTGGFVGVDVFFVISGYLITRNIATDLARKNFSLAEFFIRRARRLLPASFFVIALTLIAGYAVLPPLMLTNLGASATFALLSASNFFFWRDIGYFALANEYKPLLHTWSLGVEEQFYLVYPLFLLALMALIKRPLPRLCIVGLGLLISSSVAQYLVAHNHIDAAFYLMPFRAGEFGLGILCALLPQMDNARRAFTEGLFGVGALLVVGPVLIYTSATPFPGLSAMVPCAGAALMIYSGSSSVMASIVRSAPLVRIGILSYSLYLVHWPVLTFYNYIALYPGSLPARLALLAVSLLLAILLFTYVERPLRLGGGGITPARAKLSAIALIVALVACQALAVISRWQWASEWRYSYSALKDIRATDTVPGSECQDGFDSRQIAKITCVPGRGGQQRKALLLGESHSVHWRPALASALPRLGFSLDHFDGCVPIPNVTKYMDGREDPFCAPYTTQLESVIDGYDLIILAARWSLYTEGTVGAHETNSAARSYALSDGADGPLTSTRSKKIFATHLGRFLEVLAAKEKYVLIFGQVPELGVDLRPCVGLPDWRGILRANRCVPFYSQKEVNDRLSFTDGTIRHSAELQARTTAFLPSEYICVQGEHYCRTRMDGVWLYRDDDHLNAPGAMALAPAIEKALEALLAAR